MSIPFTQYLMPNGIQSACTVDRPAEVEVKAQRLIDAGCAFEVEMLSDYQTVSLEIVHAVGADILPVAGEIVPNGPAVLEAIDRMIDAALREVCL